MQGLQLQCEVYCLTVCLIRKVIGMGPLRLLSAAAWLAAAAGGAGGGSAREDAPQCAMMTNYLNAQYTLDVGIGTPPQFLEVVPDTGSFELVVSSDECKGCGARHRRYRRLASNSFAAKGGEEVTTLFGQGPVRSEVVLDRVELGSIVIPSQSILLMEKNELRGFDEAAYDGVMGLGVPATARTADRDLSLMAHLNASALSICFGQADGEPGRLQVGGHRENRLLFHTPFHTPFSHRSPSAAAGGRAGGLSRVCRAARAGRPALGGASRRRVRRAGGRRRARRAPRLLGARVQRGGRLGHVADRRAVGDPRHHPRRDRRGEARLLELLNIT